VSQQLLSLHLYPIKSCHGLDLTSANVGPLGLDGDRRWMITDPDGTFITQRQLPAMTRLRPTITADGLCLQGDDGETIVIPRPGANATTLTVQVWRSTLTAPMTDVAVHDWLSRQLGWACRLVYMPDELVRATNPEYSQPGDRVSFADGYPLLLATQASLDHLNQALAEPVPMDRFRPNLVVDGTTPFAEESWQQVTIGETVFDVVKPCERCVITTIDQQTGILTGKDPLRTLVQMRAPGKANFGVNLIPRRWGSITIGDQVTVG
jgi:uncharacterized protein YcbX